MRCRKVKERLDAYVSDEIAPAERVRLAKHLAYCADCRRALATVARLKAVASGSAVPPVPEGFADRLIAIARQRAAQPAGVKTNWRTWLPGRFPASIPMRAAAAAAVVFGLSLGILMGRSAFTAAPPKQVVVEQVEPADPLATYNMDALSDTPDGSLAQTYLALASGQDTEGK